MKNKTDEEIKSLDSKELIKTFLKDPKLYKEIEMVMDITLVAAIKVSVESVAESIISKYSIHNSKIRPIGDKKANDEMFIAVNGPEIGEADETLIKALNLKFGVGKWHFSVAQNLFKTSGPTVEKLLKKTSSFNIYNK